MHTKVEGLESRLLSGNSKLVANRTLMQYFMVLSDHALDLLKGISLK